MAGGTRDIIDRLRNWAAIARASLRRRPLPPARVAAFEAFDVEALHADRTEHQARGLERFASTLELDEADIQFDADEVTPTQPPSRDLIALTEDDATWPGGRVP